MDYKAVYTKGAIDDLSKLQKRTARHIVDKIKVFRQQDDPLQFAKKLKDSKCGTYRFRIGNYRVLFDLEKEGTIKILLILRVKHRKDIYKDL